MDAGSPRSLTDDEAARRLAADGANELPSPPGRPLWRIVRDTLREPMFALLLAAAILYLTLGDLAEGIFLLLGALAAIGLVIGQEARSERALAALRDLAQPQVRVVRGGVERRAPARELVAGDLILVGEGERLPADALLVQGDVLSVDESALTGESAPVTKYPAAGGQDFDPSTAPGAQAGPFLFAGAMVVGGQGAALVRRTGARSGLGRIGQALAGIGAEQTPLQKTAGRLVTVLGVVALAFCGVVALAYGLLRDDWTGGLLAGVTVAISLIPEEFPMVLAVFLALGAWRLATHNVLARRSAVIETLGGATALCVDKTGTLTENRMQVASLWTAAGERIDVAEGKIPSRGGDDLLVLARLASAVRPVDPMDRAIHLVAPAGEGALDRLVGPERAWPLHPGRLAVIQAWRADGEARVAAAKGSPEAIFALCGLAEARVAELHAVVEAFAGRGLRVLGVASARIAGACPDPPDSITFTFAGLVGFLDPLRADVPAALTEARAAGLKVIMITGDHPATAMAIARAAGLDTAPGCLRGVDIDRMTFAELCGRLRDVRVFARVTPEQKLILVNALRAHGEVVAMTGDGVNDAPALQAAHIGVAMGRRGTDVAREAADLVLLDDSFASIVGGVRLGRRIFTNLRRALTYIVAIHVPVAGVALAPILMGLPPLLYPMHVVLLELAIDPICALVFEASRSDADAMRKPPRPAREPLFGPRQLVMAVAQGLGILLVTLGVYLWALQIHEAPAARAAAFVTLVLANLVLALADSASSGARLFSRERRVFWIIVAAVLSVLALMMAVPVIADLFSVTAPDGRTILAAVAAALVGGGWMRGLAWLRTRAKGSGARAPHDKYFR